MHGLGNDFVVIDARGAGGGPVTPALARALGDRHRGVGFDQLAVIRDDAGAAAAVDFWNADGSEADACGNATRCVARLLMDETGAAALDLRTGRGLLRAEEAGGGLVRVNMGPPELTWDGVPLARAMDLDALPLDGSPGRGRHGQPALRLRGRQTPRRSTSPESARAIEHDPLFPERTNVEFVQVIDRETIRMRVWERGGMVTLACGSGACAAAVVTARRGLTGRRVTVRLDGGELGIDWRDDGVWMTGPTTLVFEGRLAADFLGARRVTAPVFATLGCRLNAYETEAMKGLAEAAGVRDAVVVNSCAVTAEAVRQARQQVRRLKRDNPAARVVVTGCAAQTEAGGLRGDARGRPGARQRREAAARGLGAAGRAAARRGSRSATSWPRRRPSAPLIDGLGTRARAYVQVQNGCDHRCTFCIIPYGRGNSRSVPAATVVAQVARLRDRGFNEVVLTGVDLTSWGADLEGGAAARRPRRGGARRRARPAAAAALLDRLGRGRPAARRGDRRRAAADAAPAPVAAGRRRPDPEADEAPAPARRRHRLLRDGAAGAAGGGVRRRPDRRLPDRDRARRSRPRSTSSRPAA